LSTKGAHGYTVKLAAVGRRLLCSVAEQGVDHCREPVWEQIYQNYMEGADMRLTPKEMDRLTIFTVAELARRRQGKGIKLNHPEAVALICDELLESGREGKSFEEVTSRATEILTAEDVMEGVPELASPLRLEVNFTDGNKLIYVQNPIR
jgi:urease subunit gamma